MKKVSFCHLLMHLIVNLLLKVFSCGFAFHMTEVKCLSLHKKRGFPLKISLVDVNKSTVTYGFGLIY